MKRILLFSVLVLLVVIGLMASIARGLHPTDLGSRMEPTRLKTFQRLGIVVPDRFDEVREFDRRYKENPTITLLHILPGGLFLLFAFLQFSSDIRARHITFHRWSGRILVITGVVSTLAGFYFGVVMPFGGIGEMLGILSFGVLFVVALSLAWLAIRRNQIALHREWMIRAFAVAIGISTVRIVSILVDLALTPSGYGSKEIFVISIWTGWLLTVLLAEFWIRHTRAVLLQKL